MGVLRAIWAGITLAGTVLKGVFQKDAQLNTPDMKANAIAQEEAKKVVDNAQEAIKNKDTKAGGLAIGE